jgi:putative ubiquitin-RnfH superfamily antitoxin RatB of RatAB toxin-antitoxin module
MKVELVYLADHSTSFHQVLELPNGSTISALIMSSHLFEQYPQLQIDNLVVGIFGKRAQLEDSIYEGDRVEIYRELTISPMDKRRLLAETRKNKKSQLDK